MKKFSLSLFIIFMACAVYSQKKSISPELLMTKEFMGEERRTLVSRNMKLNILEFKKFWPIYDDYENEREILVNKKLAIAQKYIGERKKMTDIELDLLQNQSFSLDKKLAELKEKTYLKIKERLGTTPATKFIQIDNQISNYIAFELFKSIPLEGVISKEEREKLEAEERAKQQ